MRIEETFFSVGAAGRRFLLLALPLLLTASVGGAEPIRLALVATDSSLLPAVDTLTAGFSRQPNLALLERAQVDLAYRELAQSAAQGDWLRLGQTLDADGVLILDRPKVEQGKPASLDVRLVTVRTGVVLRQRTYPWPINELAEWSNLVQTQVTPLLPKLMVLANDAVPLSILNLRSAVRSPAAESLETELTFLLQNRLMQEPSIFILERRRLGSLAEEKELAGRNESSFWNGAYLLEGSIDQAGFSPDQMTVNLRIKPPAGGQGQELSAKGPRTDQAGLIEHLARSILRSLDRKTQTQAWKPAEEAVGYHEEARWALRWKMYEAAQAAADAAWALGKRDLDSAYVRVKSYLDVLPPKLTPFQHPSLVLGYNFRDTNFVGRYIRETSSKYFASAYLIKTNGVEFSTLAAPPDPQLLAEALRMVDLYDSSTRALGLNGAELDTPWYFAAVEVLEFSSRVLQQFYFVPNSQESVTGQLAELRSKLRNLDNWVSQSPGVRASYYHDNPNEIGKWMRLASSHTNLFRCAVDWAGFWQESPEEGAGYYRKLFGSPYYPALDEGLWSRPLERPLLVGWNAKDQSRATNLIASFAKDAQPLAERIWESYGTNRRPPGFAYLIDAFQARWNLGRSDSSTGQARNSNIGSPPTTASNKQLGSVTHDLTPSSASRSVFPESQPAANASRDASSDGRTLTLRNQATSDPLLLVETYVPLPVERFQGRRIVNTGIFDVWCLKGKLWVDIRYDEFDPRSIPETRAPIGCFEFENDQWEVLEESADDPERVRNPITFNSGPRRFSRFQEFEGAVYLSHLDKIRRYDRKTRVWSTLNLPVRGLAQISVFNGHLYAAGVEQLFEITNEGNSFALVASIRRRPALNALDLLPTLGWSRVVPGPDGNPRIYGNERMYEWQSGDWKEATPPMKSIWRCNEADNGILIYGRIDGQFAGWYHYPATGAAPEVLVKTVDPGSNNRGPAPNSGLNPLWLPSREIPMLTEASYDGSQMVLYTFEPESSAMPAGTIRVPKPFHERKADLLVLEKGSNSPLQIPLKLAPPPQKAAIPQGDPAYGTQVGNSRTWLIRVPSGFVLTDSTCGGFWQISRAQFAAALEVARNSQKTD